jgi:hypothetical protein
MDSIVTEKIRESSNITVEEDKFGFYSLGECLLNYILNKQFPISVGIYGKWGTGKTVLVNFIKEIGIKRDNIEFIEFDAIEFKDSKDTIFWYLVGKIFHKITNGADEKIKLLLESVSKFTEVLSETDGKVGTFFKGINTIKSFFKKDKSAKAVFDAINNELGYSKKKYLIIIDNLDRLSPKDTISFLEQLKFFLLKDGQTNFKEFAYILLCDFDILKKEIANLYGNNIDVRDYLNKLIEIPFQLPYVQKDKCSAFIRTLLNQELNEECVKDIKNFILELDMIFIVAKSRGLEWDFLNNLPKILTLRLIKAKFPHIYSFVRARKLDNYPNAKEFAKHIVKHITQGPYIDTKVFEDAIKSPEENETKLLYNQSTAVYGHLTNQKILNLDNGNGFFMKNMNLIIEMTESTPETKINKDKRTHKDLEQITITNAVLETELT